MHVPVAGHVELLPILVLLDSLHHTPIRYTHGLDQSVEVLEIEMTVRAAVRLPSAGRVLREDLLTAERAVTSSSAIRVPADISVGVADVVLVVFVELIIGYLVEAAAPEHEALLQVETQALQEQCVLQTTVVFEMSVSAE